MSQEQVGGGRRVGHPYLCVRAVIADQLRALGRNVLGELGEKLQRREDLEIPLRARGQVRVLRLREAAVGVLLGLVDHLSRLVHVDQAR